MVSFLRGWLDNFLGSGDAAVTVPPLDGALKPNNRLEEANPGLSTPAPDCLYVFEGKTFYASLSKLFATATVNGVGRMIFDAQAEITAIAVSRSGIVAVAAGGTISFLDTEGTPAPHLNSGTQTWNAVTALAFAEDGSLVVAVGSTENALAEWQRDLLDAGCSGSIWRLELQSGKATRLADRLRFPYGVIVEPGGHIVVSEAWGKRLIRLSSDGRNLGDVIEDLPGYPGRISRSDRGGYWLSVFAPRSPLIEFVLREPAYRKAMMAEVDKEFWIAPALRSGLSFREPMQGGALKQMGILKPWAPTRSYGLVVELTKDFVPIRSFHSRAGGRRHGVTSAVEVGSSLWVASKGGDEIFAVDLGGN